MAWTWLAITLGCLEIYSDRRPSTMRLMAVLTPSMASEENAVDQCLICSQGIIKRFRGADL